MSYKEWEDSFGSISEEWRNDSGALHRELGPAYIRRNRNGFTEIELFSLNGFSHREDGPAEIYYNSDGSIAFQQFWFKGRYLGRDSRGFWGLWEILTSKQRQSDVFLGYLAIYS